MQSSNPSPIPSSIPHSLEVTVHSPHSVGSNTQPLHRQCLCKLSLILLHGNIISFLHLFIYSFIYLFICSSMDLQVNILYFWLQPSTCLFFLLLKLLLLWPLGVLPVGSCSIGICPFLCFCFFSAHPYFLG